MKLNGKVAWVVGASSGIGAAVACSGLEILGSGPGTIPLAEIISAILQFMAIATTGDLPIDLDEVPPAEVESAWQRGSGGRRTVLRP
jgi:hypothetical protein